ncbi:MAG: RNA-processing protein [Nanoarchaeota archaeon]|nr:RNA-processing protein [Nanoarchaeota archaeon]
MEFSKIVKIPEERVIKLLEVRDLVEEKLDVSIKISGNDVMVSGSSIELVKAHNVVMAIGRGFSTDKALFLLQDDFSLDVIEIGDFARTQKAFIRLKGRVIGDEGRAKRFIEKNTNCLIRVYGKTVSIIGKSEELINARRAVIMLLEGSKHGTAYRFLDEKIVD